MVDAEDAYGSGIELTGGWDLFIDQTGDIGGTFGEEELLKDLAFNTARRIDDEIGEPKTKETYSSISAIVREEVLQDPRIDSILNIDVRDGTVDEVEVDLTVLVNDDERQSLVFEV